MDLKQAETAKVICAEPDITKGKVDGQLTSFEIFFLKTLEKLEIKTPVNKLVTVNRRKVINLSCQYLNIIKIEIRKKTEKNILS